MGTVSDLSRFRLEDDEVPVVELGYPTPPDLWEFKGRLLMVDQAVAKAGWLIYDFFDMGESIEIARGMWQAPDVVKGHEATLTIAALEYEFFRGVIGQWGPKCIVHEMPPVGGAMARPESSLVAATSLRCAAAYFGKQVVMVGAQKAKKRWTGNGNAKKPMVKSALLAWRPELANLKPWNQDVADALALGLTWAETRGL